MKETKLHPMCIKENQALITPKDFLNEFPEASDFIKNFGDKCIIVRHTIDSDYIYVVNLFSEKYEYTATFINKSDRYSSKYCSCGFTCRIHRPMEDWNRGNDMIDGNNIKFVLENFEKEILQNELITFGKVSVEKEKVISEEPADYELELADIKFNVGPIR